MLNLDTLDFTRSSGLVTVVAQDIATGAVLMVAHADREALERTIETGEMHYRSRTRGLWHKGATSGNVQRVVSLAADCDGDAVLALVRPAGPACHTGATSCFGGAARRADALSVLDETIGERAAALDARGVARDLAQDVAGGVARGMARGAPPEPHDGAAPDDLQHRSAAVRTSSPHPPAPSYTQRLLSDRNLRLKKLGEETAELVLACADGDRPRAAEEAADLIYHALVALHAVGLSLDDVRCALAARAR